MLQSQIDSLKKNLEESNITISKLKEQNNVRDRKAEEQLNKNRELIQNTNFANIAIQTQMYKASDDRIRYFAENERDVAYALQSIMNQTYPKRKFKLQTVYTPSPGSVSIFLKS